MKPALIMSTIWVTFTGVASIGLYPDKNQCKANTE